MANFDTSHTKMDSVRDAVDLLDRIRALYVHAKEMQTLLARYQAGTDATFNAAANALFTSAERTELGQMLSQVNTLITDWEANHPWITT